MVKRATLEERLAAISKLREDGDGGEAARTLLGKEISSKSSLVVAAAAHAVGELGIDELGRELPKVFSRLLRNPAKSDPQCAAKLAIVEALTALDAPTDDLFLAGLRFRQPEPVWGGKIDSAAPVRAACAFALVKMAHPDAVRAIAVLLADSERIARVGAAEALGAAHEPAAAIPLLRFKVTLGDEDPEVLRECFAALLGLEGAGSVTFVAEFLGRDAVTAECAALALGASRLEQAFTVLRELHEEAVLGDLRGVAALSLSMLRSDKATRYLLRVVSDGAVVAAMEAVTALAIHKHDRGMRARVAEAIAGRKERELKDRFATAFEG